LYIWVNLFALKKILLFFWLLGNSHLILAQEFILRDSLVLNTQDSITDFSADDFNHLYYIRNFSELIKINTQTGEKNSFSNQAVLEKLNAQNTLQITVKSSLFSILILDNRLNLFQDAIRFPVGSNFSPTLTALVDNNYLWGYDPVLQRLILWNYHEKKVFRQSVILNEKTADEYYSELIYAKDKIYLAGPNKILVFDEFANLKESIPFREFKQIEVENGMLYFTHNQTLYRMNLRFKEIMEIETHTPVDYFSINSRSLIVLNGKVVYIYDSQNKP